MSFRQRLHKLLSSPWLVLLNALLCMGAVMANAHHQVFCRPVPWAAVVLVIVFTPLITYNLIRDRIAQVKGLVFFLFGIAACICLYCIVFLSYLSVAGLFSIAVIPYYLISTGHFNGPMALPFASLPLILSGQLLVLVLGRRATRTDRKHFGAGVALSLAFAVVMTTWFNLHYATIRTALSQGATNEVPRNYMTERMLGMHVKYHLSFCELDGWRPPLHDPSIVVAVWLTAPFRSDLDWRGMAPFGARQRTTLFDERIAAYRVVFPERPLRQKCSCAKGYRKFYMNDPRLQ